MNGVSPSGFSNGASRSEAAKFFSQSENDVAAAFAELLKFEGITPADEPASTPPPAAGTQRSTSDSSKATAPESNASGASATTPSPSSTSPEQSEDEIDRDDDETVVASAAVPIQTPQQNQADAAPAEGSGSTEEAELEAILADARSVQQEIDSSKSDQAQHGQSNVSAPGESDAESVTEESIAATEAPAKGAVVDPAADLSPKVNSPGDKEIFDPLRRPGLTEEESDSEEGFAVEDLADDSGVDEAALAELAAKAAAAAETGGDGKSAGRDAKSKPDRREKSDVADGVGAASQPARADLATDVSSAVIPSATSNETATSATKSDGAAVEAAGTNPIAGAAFRHEATGSLQRSIERPTESDRRQLAAADRSRFFDRVERAFKSAEQGDGTIRMRLHPGELGAMQLTLEKGEAGEWIARIQTETLEAKQTLLEHAGALKERLADQDFRLARIEVETPADRRQQSAPDFRENPQSFSRGREPRDDERRGEDRTADAAPAGASPGDRSRRLDVTI